MSDTYTLQTFLLPKRLPMFPDTSFVTEYVHIKTVIHCFVSRSNLCAYRNCYTLFYVFSTFRSSALYEYNSTLYYYHLLSFIMLKFTPMHSTNSHSVITHTHMGCICTYVCVCPVYLLAVKIL